MTADPGSGQREYLIVARVRRPHGLRGELLVALDTDTPRHVFRVGRMLQVGGARGEPTGRTLTVESMRPTTGGAILRLEGVDSMEAAGDLRGAVLMMDRVEALPAGRDEVHYPDLIGLRALHGEVELGTVRDILEMPSVEMLVVRGAGGKEILVPFVREIIERVDLESREVRLRLPEGFLEI
jgi:16S rRNA processing protein RimM